MIDKLSLAVLIQNPRGKGAAHTSAGWAVKENLENRYDEIKNKIIIVSIIKNGNDYFIFSRIPSENDNIKKTYFDVVFKFQKNKDGDSLMSHYDLKIFTNCMAHMFIYTYVFFKNKFHIEEMKHKYSKRALTLRPKVTNPIEELGFEKSSYYLALYIQEKKLYDPNNEEFKKYINKKDNLKKMINSVIYQEDKYVEYIKEEKKETRKIKKSSVNKKMEKLRTVRKKRMEERKERMKRPIE